PTKTDPMPTPPTRTTSTLIIVALLMLMAGCAGMSKAEAKAKTHELTDALPQRVGTNPHNSDEGPVGALDPQSSPYYTYDVEVDIKPDTLERIRGELLDDLRDQGWAVHDRHPDDTTRAKFSFI